MGNKDCRERNYGIDALRIVSMFMILVLHILGPGGLLTTVRFGTWRYFLFWFLEIAAFSAVNCYALISGYVGIKSRYKYSNFVVLWLRVVFLTVLVTSLLSVLVPEKVTVAVWLRALFPVSLQQYWYVTAYALLFLLMPVLNMAIDRLERKQLKVTISCLVVATMVIPTILQTDIFRLDNGYSCWWLVIMYIIGGYFGRYDDALGRLAGKKALLFFGATVIVTLLVRTFLEWVGVKALASGLVVYVSPFVVVMALCLLKYFSRLRVTGNAKKLISFFAPLAFSVYLIHSCLIHIDSSIWNFTWILQLPTFAMPFAVFGVATLIFVALSLVDWVRERMFLKLKIKQRLNEYELRLRRS